MIYNWNDKFALQKLLIEVPLTKTFGTHQVKQAHHMIALHDEELCPHMACFENDTYLIRKNKLLETDKKVNWIFFALVILLRLSKLDFELWELEP